MKNTDPETWNAIQESQFMNPEPEEKPGKDSDIEKDFRLENEKNKEVNNG